MEVTPAPVTLAFEGHSIRYFADDDAMEWVVADVVAAVKLSSKAKTSALESLAPDDLGTRTTNVLGRKQKLVTVTEAGLYQLLCHGDKTIAKRFKHWLCREVLRQVNSGEMDSQLAAATQQIYQLKQKLELADATAQSTQTALFDARERAKWSERMNELRTRELEQQRQTIASLKSQLASTQTELEQCRKIIVQTASLLGKKATEIYHQQSHTDEQGQI